MSKVLENSTLKDLANAYFKELDKNEDGKVSLEEYLTVRP
jgi:hypothetical protein